MIKYVVVSNIIMDDIVLPDGTHHLGLLGGAGTYAAAGMRIWSDSVGIVSGVGVDFERNHGSWFRCNNIDLRGVSIRAQKSPRSWVVYQLNGEREETPQMGAEHFRMMEPRASDLPVSYLSALGVYVFFDESPEYWEEMLALRKSYNFSLMWEIAANAAEADNWEQVVSILRQVDLFSINYTEGSRLCQTLQPEIVLNRLLDAGARVVVLRMGRDGAIVASRNSVWHIPVVTSHVMDVTGAGNAFTGGFLTGYCESGGNLARAGVLGAVSASFMLDQYGPPARIDRKLRRLACARARDVAPLRIR